MADRPIALAFHGHFYQPPRENPWTEEVPREAGAAPFHDWNEKIALEAYRPNAFARIVDEHGRVVSIVNNYEHLSFDVGPTLTTWLADNEAVAFERIVEGDRRGGGGMAQAFFHIILPLATERDVRTMVRWGMREFEVRFGRRAQGIWLPETAVNDGVLRVLAQEGVGFTVLAPYQAATEIDPRHAYRWVDPEDAELGVDLVFYDGPLSHAVAFELNALSSEAFVDRVTEAAPAGGLVAVAADGETFGHHHQYGDRFLAYALAVEAPKRGIEVVSISEWLAEHPPTDRVEIVESAWSCAHGVGRWKEDCGCSTGGLPEWTQRWRAPLRRALDVVREAVDGVLERRGAEVLHDPWAARDDYVDVLLGEQSREEFARRHVKGDVVTAFTVMEAARHALAMYTSCGWFFNDLAGLETVQVLRYAARAMDCLEELGENPPTEVFLRILDEAESNDPAEGSGRDIWRRHVETARVDTGRAVAQLALVELLEHRDPPATVGAFDVHLDDHGHGDRGALSMSWGKVRLTHRRTGRETHHVYAALHLGGLEVLGAARPPDAGRDRDAFARLRSAFEFDAPITTLLRLVSDGFGPAEFGIRSGVPDGAEQILRTVARSLADRFSAAFDRLYADHRPTFVALTSAHYPLPPELRAPAELALARRLELEIAAQNGSLDPADYGKAIAIAREARTQGVELDTRHARHVLERLLLNAVEHAVVDPARATSAVTGLEIARELDVHPSLERVQEIVFDALQREGEGADPRLRRLAAALNLAV
ncbi:MAG TPA: DUF3536 domain-containing protein [Acidimicrobiales bacterium]|nr:DUF3536 domain-containing protein [Acidimicrobiales bacterium]